MNFYEDCQQKINVYAKELDYCFNEIKDNFLKIQFNANEDILEKAKIVSAKLSILREVCEYLENFETSKEQIDYYKKYLSDSISTDPFVSSNPYCVYVSLELLKDFEAKKLYQSYTD